MERAASSIGSGLAAQGHANIPSSSRLDPGELKIGNCGGESSRIETRQQ
jgi:hypothetical protein